MKSKGKGKKKVWVGYKKKYAADDLFKGIENQIYGIVKERSHKTDVQIRITVEEI